jgi:beta-lactam-binding protein with PASTA domain
VYPLEAPVTLARDNTIVIELASKPGTYLTLTQFQDAPSLNASVNPDTILAGQTAALSWSSSLADSVSIDQGIGEVALSGSLNVSPLETTIYTISATGAGGTTTASATVTVIALPVISMTAEPQTIIAGESFVLSWSVSHADSVIGEQTTSTGTLTEEIPLSGANTLFPCRTTTYTITAVGPGGSVSQSITVEVNVPEPVVSFSASPAQMTVGSQSILTWNSSFADECAITPDVGQVETNGSFEISPAKTTTYTLTATGAGGASTRTVTVEVQPLQPAITFSADPLEIDFNQSSTLSWQSFLADSCEITPDIGPVDLNGSSSVTPTQTTTYTLTATGPGGTTTKSLTIRLPDVDLEPVHIDTSDVETNIQSLAISGTIDIDIKNNGTRTVDTDYDITLFEDINNNSDFDADIDAIMGIHTIPPGQSPGETLTATIPIGGGVSFADNRIFAWVDSGNAIRESNEANNITHSMADCEYHPPVGSFNPIVEWGWTGSKIEPNSKNIDSIPVVINLNDDNGDGMVNMNDIPDIVFMSYSPRVIRAISGDGKGELFTIPSTIFQGWSYSEPVVGDIDGDHLPEIIAVMSGGPKIAAFDNSGALKWISNSLPGILTNKHPGISLADIDQDGRLEICFAHHVLNADGTNKWSGGNGYGAGSPCIADIDLDGVPEVVNGNTVYRSNGELYWTNPLAPAGFSGIGNFDDDPFPEIVLVTGIVGASGKICLLEHTGNLIWETYLPGGGGGGAPCIADYDNDRVPEIGVAGSRFYTVFESDGSIKWQSGTSDLSSNITGSSVFDFEGDGSAEVVYADEKKFRIYRGIDGEILYDLPNTSHTVTEYPVVADVDNDNNAEIIVVANGINNGLRIIGDANDTWVNTRKIWNQHAYHITNVNDDGTIPQFEANNWETFNNYRQNEMLNPFGCSDLSASMIRINRTNMPDSAGLIVRIGNGGALHVNAGANVSFYNGDPASNGVLLGTVQTPARLYPGEYVDLTLPWNQPPVDINTIYVKADDDGTGKGKISESNEENNTAVAEINLGNQSPIAHAGPDQTVIIQDIVILNGAGSSDPENRPISYAWSFISKPLGSMAVLTAPDTDHPLFTADMPGQYIIQLTVNDGQLDSGIDLITITASPPITVPDVTGLARQTAETRITKQGLIVGAISHAFSDTVVLDSVVSQTPSAGSIAPLNAPVDLTLSLGVQMVTVPDVTGMTPENATAALTAATLAVGEITQEYINIQPAGLVFDQSECAGTQTAHNTPVNLKVSLGVWSGEDTQPPYAWITATPAQVDIGNPVFIKVTAADNVGVATTQLFINNQPVALTNGQAAYVPQAGGYFTAKATAVDSAGLTGTATTVFKVINPYDTVPPYVSLDEKDCPDAGLCHNYK